MKTWALNMSILPWPVLHIFFITCIKYFLCQWVWERGTDKKGVRKSVLGGWQFCCLFSQLNVWIYFRGLSCDFYYLYLGSGQKVSVVNCCIFLLLSPTCPIPSSFPNVLWDSLWAPSVPEASSSGLSHTQFPPLAGFIVLLWAPPLQNVLGITLSLGSSNMLYKCLFMCLFSLLEHELLSGRCQVLLICVSPCLKSVSGINKWMISTPCSRHTHHGTSAWQWSRCALMVRRSVD